MKRKMERFREFKRETERLRGRGGVRRKRKM